MTNIIIDIVVFSLVGINLCTLWSYDKLLKSYMNLLSENEMLKQELDV